MRRAALVGCAACALGILLARHAAADAVGVKFVGRWSSSRGLPTATYAGSAVRMRFQHSSAVFADLSVIGSRGSQDLFISVSVDGGNPVRIGLSRGSHQKALLASGLSDGPHLVSVRKEGEPFFGAIQWSNPSLDVAGRWLPIDDGNPIVEVVGDSNATGICALGPDSPRQAQDIHRSSWASESDSWVGLLERELAAAGHPIDFVDLAISGSTTQSEADAYDYAAPGYDKDKFREYGAPGPRHAAVALLWGGANDRDAGGARASGDPPTPSNLSPFQRGLFEQLNKIFARNPQVRIVLLEYIDSTIPDWTRAYAEVQGLFTEDQRRRIFTFSAHDPKGAADTCEIDPKGHPNASMHAAWATQIFSWLTATDTLRRLGLPPAARWNDE